MGKVYNSSSSRGITNLGWLYANYSYNDTNYTKNIQFSLLRDLNEDVFGQGKGFAPHPRENLKIITLPLAGALNNIGVHMS
jgi:hypothetical protein